MLKGTISSKRFFLALISIGTLSCSTEDSEDQTSTKPVIENLGQQSERQTTFTNIKISGRIIYEKPEELLAYGVVWGLEPGPTFDDNVINVTNDKSNLNAYKVLEDISFTTLIPDLLPNTTYYFRVYASTVEGTDYGEEIVQTTLSFEGTSWEFSFFRDDSTSWQALITFNEDGSLQYYETGSDDELYAQMSSWNLEGNQLTFGLGGPGEGQIYRVDGALSGNTMEGTYRSGEESNPWEALRLINE